MSDRHTRRTLLARLPRLTKETASSAVSGLLALVTVGLVALGIGMIFPPAGVIAAGLGAAVLQWQFFGAQS